MTSAPGYHAIRVPARNQKSRFGEGDILVLFGELFNRGYANGLVEEAERRGMKIIRATVGRRDKDGSLRSLTAEEIAEQPQPLINVPLEAGFDLEPAADGLSPVDRLKEVKLSEWESCVLPREKILESRKKGRARFTESVRNFVTQLKPHLPKGKNVLFAHLMAGGVPRAKIIMPLMNRSVKGTGDRYLPSEKFWSSDLGWLCDISFEEVTATTFETLLRQTSDLRKDVEQNGGFCSYTAYGYHGTEILLGGQMAWQSYTPYLQGWAKKALEKISREWSAQGVRICVYNCPEILTNSSSIFQGVEIPLYPLLLSLQRWGADSPATLQVWEECRALLKPDVTLQDILKICDDTLRSPAVQARLALEKWPEHSAQDQLEIILNTSEKLTGSHQDTKRLMTTVLSEVVFSSCGKVMLEDSAQPEAPVSWLNHDVVARSYLGT